MILYSCLSIVFWAGINERVTSLLVLRLYPEASSALLSFFFSIAPMAAVCTALASPLVEKSGKKNVMVPLYLTSLCFAFLLPFVPALKGPLGGAATVAVLAVILCCFHASRAIGISGWFPLINDNVPDEMRGRFFGKLRTSWQTVLILMTAATGLFFGDAPELWRFQTTYAIALIGVMASTFVIMTIPEAPLSASGKDNSFWKLLSIPFGNKVFVNFLIFGAVYSLALGLAGPFAIRCLKHTLHAGDGFVVWLETLSGIGAACTLPVWGWFVDRFGNKAIFALLLPPLAISNLFWLMLSPDFAWWREVVGICSVLQGICAFGNSVGVTDMMLGGAAKESRSAYINLCFMLNTVTCGIAPYLGAVISNMVGDWSIVWGVFTIDSNRAVFLFRAFLLLLPLFFLSKLSRKHGGHLGVAFQDMGESLASLLGRRKNDD